MQRTVLAIVMPEGVGGRNIVFSSVYWAGTKESSWSTTDAIEGLTDAPLWDVVTAESHRPHGHATPIVWEILQDF